MNFIKKKFAYIMSPLVLLLLAFIPLYPKLPLVDIQNTWVYIRVEDFVVLFVLILWFFLLLKKQVTLKTPLTIPILAFWIVGAVATIHGVVIIFPTIARVFPNVALLAYLRHIEYLSLFFVAYSAVKSKKFVFASIWTIVATLLGVIFYGFGQRLLAFPAYLTMNEEYAKGIPILVSPLNRISSTFAGHYDLAAYLVLILPIIVSLAFGFKNIVVKIALLLTFALGIVLLFMTVSRVSFAVLFIALFFVLFFQKRKLVLITIPTLIIAGLVFFYSQSSLLSRFGNTVEEIDVLVDAKSGASIGQVKFQPRNYLYSKNVVHDEMQKNAIYPVTQKDILNAKKEGIPSNLISYMLPKKVPIVQAEVTSTGETLPQGSSYINLSLSPVTKRLSNYFFEYPIKPSSTSAIIKIIPGDYLVKRASAYDLSFTTRFQGEWPNALLAFGRNLFFGSGYGSVSLAVDNNYLRMLGETGAIGILSFFTIFIVFGLYIKRTLPLVESRIVKSFIIGFACGVIGLSLNAVLIDVFEASKVAFVLWILTGIVVGTLSLYQTKNFNIYKELLKILASSYAVIVYLLLATIVIFSPTISSYFIGDDFTWFRWAARCMPQSCSILSTIFEYFLNSEGFFYRPGTKMYFLLMYQPFWLNQVVYHIVSIFAHFIVVILLYVLSRKIIKNNLLAAFAAFVFIAISGYLEIVLWISSTGHLFNAIFILVSLLAFIKWDESRNSIHLILSLLSAVIALSFHELGIITPFLALSYKIANSELNIGSIVLTLKRKIYLLLFTPLLLYFLVRVVANTFWFHGDYSYDILKLPLNIIGNILGYLMVVLFGPSSYGIYSKIRDLMKINIPMAILLGIILVFVLYFGARFVIKKFTPQEKKVVIFSGLFFVVSLIPFLGLGNITFRYSYLASFGVIMVGAILIRKLYHYLIYYGKDIAITVTASLILIFSLIHLVQGQQAIIEWRGAGQKIEKFLTSLDSLYQDSWSNYKVDLYFTKVPIKNMNAWVLPVGLDDAVWFAFKNENITVHSVSSELNIPKEVFSQHLSWIFEFQSDGSLKEIHLGNDKKR